MNTCGLDEACNKHRTGVHVTAHTSPFLYEVAELFDVDISGRAPLIEKAATSEDGGSTTSASGARRPMGGDMDGLAR